MNHGCEAVPGSLLRGTAEHVPGVGGSRDVAGLSPSAFSERAAGRAGSQQTWHDVGSPAAQLSGAAGFTAARATRATVKPAQVVLNRHSFNYTREKYTAPSNPRRCLLCLLTALSVFFFLEWVFSKSFKTSSVKRGTGELLLDAGFFQCWEPWAFSGHN